MSGNGRTLLETGQDHVTLSGPETAAAGHKHMWPALLQSDTRTVQREQEREGVQVGKEEVSFFFFSFFFLLPGLVCQFHSRLTPTP